MKKILIIGTSDFATRVFRKNFLETEYTIIKWRSDYNTLSVDYIKNISTIFICGYDYGTYLIDHKSYLNSNVYRILNFIKRFDPHNVKIIYINTLLPTKSKTFSRYLYAKYLLLYCIYKAGFNITNISLPMIISDKGYPLIYGSFFSKVIFYCLYKTQLVNYINYHDLEKVILASFFCNNSVNNYSFIYPLSPALITLPRTLFIDRLLRITLG
jgi:hypothetical protein